MSQEKTWIKTKPEELEKLIIDLAKKGHSPGSIGLILRDQHGIPKTKLFGKKISQILKTNNIEINFEKDTLNNNINKLKTHINTNKHDYSASRSLSKKLWAMHKLEK